MKRNFSNRFYSKQSFNQGSNRNSKQNNKNRRARPTSRAVGK